MKTEKPPQTTTRGWNWKDEVFFSDSTEGKRLKWAYIKDRPDIHAVVMACYKHFGKLADVRVYRRRNADE